MTSAYGPYGHDPAGDVHETVGAYALGVLDDAEATAFEAHLAGCERCAEQLEELTGLEPLLAALADLPAGGGTPEIGDALAARPGERLAESLAEEVARTRARRRRRGLCLAAAAALLVVGGPLAVLAVTSGGDDGDAPAAVAAPHPTSPAEEAFRHDMDAKVSATDPTTHVSATVGMESKPWGTHTVLRLGGVKGPLKCSLVAVGRDGERETVTTWSVPAWGYGITGSTHERARYPLYVHGGAAFDRTQIDRFEVETLDGKLLVSVHA
jgi:hypothetical protein